MASTSPLSEASATMKTHQEVSSSTKMKTRQEEPATTTQRHRRMEEDLRSTKSVDPHHRQAARSHHQPTTSQQNEAIPTASETAEKSAQKSQRPSEGEANYARQRSRTTREPTPDEAAVKTANAHSPSKQPRMQRSTKAVNEAENGNLPAEVANEVHQLNHRASRNKYGDTLKKPKDSESNDESQRL